jgi:hypothetical protein
MHMHNTTALRGSRLLACNHYGHKQSHSAQVMPPASVLGSNLHTLLAENAA